jgi:hypothetical protein
VIAMPYFEVDFPKELFKNLSDEISEKMLNESVPILVDSLQTIIRTEHSDSGELWKSIKPFRPRKTKDGVWTISASPTGKHKGKLLKSAKVFSRSKKGTKTSGQALWNDDKLWFIEYGNKNQTAKPVIARATNRVMKQVVDKMQEVFNREVVDGKQ